MAFRNVLVLIGACNLIIYGVDTHTLEEVYLRGILFFNAGSCYLNAGSWAMGSWGLFFKRVIMGPMGPMVPWASSRSLVQLWLVVGVWE